MAQVKTSTRSQARSVDLEKVVAAAAELFDKKGYQNTTMQDLAEYLGVTKPTLYTRTPSKSMLLEQIFKRVTAEADEVMASLEGTTFPNRIERALRGWTFSSVKLQAHYRVFFSDERELPPQVLKSFRKWSAKRIDNLRLMIEEGQECGAFRPDLDARVVAFDVIAVGHWTAKWYDGKGSLTLEQIADTQCKLFLGGLLVDPSKGEP
jgi:AcrR family transcriptional regulator